VEPRFDKRDEVITGSPRFVCPTNPAGIKAERRGAFFESIFERHGSSSPKRLRNQDPHSV
jgi:hypothetical protein